MCKRLQWSGRRYDCRRISPHPLPRRFLCIHFDQVSSFFYKPPLYHAPVKLLDSSYTSSLCYDRQSIMLPAKSRKGQHAVKISCHEYKLDSKQIIGIRGNMATRKHSTANITRIVAEKEYVQCKLTLCSCVDVGVCIALGHETCENVVGYSVQYGVGVCTLRLQH